MISLLPLETLGYDRTFFKLPITEDEKHPFIYYTFEDNVLSRQPSYWDIVGLHRCDKDRGPLDMRLLHIEEELLDWEEFEALHDASNYLSLKPATLLGLIQFIEDTLVEFQTGDLERSLKYFSLLSTDELAQLRLSEWEIIAMRGSCYRYFPSEQVQSEEYISLIEFPTWSSRYGANQITMLEFATFERQRLDDPQFNPFDAPEWLGHMTFDQQALREFVVLLKQHTYEQFVSTSQRS